MKLLLLSILLVGCAQSKPVTHDARLMPVAELVYSKLYQLGSKPIPLKFISIKVGTFNDTSLAKCYRYSDGSRSVVFAETTMNNSTITLEGVMLHELGHCAFNLDHNDEITNRMPKSIMHTYFNSYYWEKYQSYYYDELVYEGRNFDGRLLYGPF